ncbi:oligopeptide transport system substrate-binding protein [Enterococcus sp. PF1-24]|uniref:peptide ABC transporter substrate-binding protein n=1 Tax=unclassified Enterococcus TaxID=2608891 RepID=UPI002473AB1D|nr:MULTISPECIES: peptide ABC transporter substrate-binding protein [unclassified Enterococcus]MDH6365172.1 oligopeptide transport system substrate-binding protein [Enterococcus sp. PFB1-1]MDH6402244.1 oligopeptide transport system substrate-binding protein [Enterococcus sp. PF1-24]
MKKKIFSLLAVSALLLSACSSGGQTTDSDTANEGSNGNNPLVQKIAVSTAGELSTLDSGQYTDVNSSDMIGQVTEGLYRTDKEGNPELAMAATEPKVSEDGLVYTFEIRDAQWSNGDPVKAEDFEYAFKYVANPVNGSSSINQMDVIKNGSKIRQEEAKPEDLGVKALDDKTLEIALESPIPYLNQVLVGTPFMPKNKAFAEEQGSAYGTSADNFVGNGPFLIEGWDGTNLNWTLVKNPDYWDAENVQLEEIAVQVVKETATGANMFDTGELDFTTLTDTYAQQYQDSEYSHYVSKAMVGYLSPNQRREVTGNVKVRQAIMQAIDKEGFAEKILGDGSKALNGFVPENFAKNPDTGEDFRIENGELLPYDVEAAQVVWEEAKEELGQKEITLELLSADTAAAKKTVEYVQGQLQENLPGLTIKVKSVPLQNRLDFQTKGEFDLVFGTWTPDYADPINFLEFYDSKGGLNTAGYVSESYDQGLADVKVTLAQEPTARWERMKELEKQLILEDTAVLPLYQGAVAYLQSDQLHDLQIFPFSRTVSYRLVYVA